MKIFKKFGIIVLAAVIGFVMIGCGDNEGDDLGGSTGGNGALTGLKFDMTGAQAILAAEATGGRSLQAEDGVLFKLMEDGSVKSLFDFKDMYVPSVKFIARSPVPGKKDLYICFEGSFGYNEEVQDEWGNTYSNWVNVPGFLHVKEDGSVYNILGEQTNNTWYYLNYHQNTDPIAFDGLGNAYFTVSEQSGSSHTNVIYQYNPEKMEKKQMTVAAPNINYDHVALTTNGSYLIVRGNRWNNNNNFSFLRLIPTANPNAMENIFYSSNWNSYINSFAVNSDTNEAYVSGRGLDQYANTESNLDYWMSGLYKISFGGFSDNTWEPVYVSNYNNTSDGLRGWALGWYNMGNYINGYYTTDGVNVVDYNTEGAYWVNGYYPYTFQWNEQYKKSGTDNDPDFEKIMTAIYGYFKTDNVEYRKNSKTDLEALQDYIEAQINTNTYESIYNNLVSYNFADDCYIKGTNNKAVYQNYDVGDARRLVTVPNKSIWGEVRKGNTEKWVFCQLVNAQGKRDFIVPAALDVKTVSKIIPTQDFVYFTADISDTAVESGYQNIYRLSFNNINAPELENMLRHITRNIKTMEIYDFSIGGNFLYFSGTQGVDLLTGKIDLTTGVYTELQFGARVTHILSY